MYRFWPAFENAIEDSTFIVCCACRMVDIFVARDVAGMRQLLTGTMSRGQLAAFEDKHLEMLLEKGFVTEDVLRCATMTGLREPPDLGPARSQAVLSVFDPGLPDTGKSLNSSA